jgi:hypothetical protein
MSLTGLYFTYYFHYVHLSSACPFVMSQLIAMKFRIGALHYNLSSEYCVVLFMSASCRSYFMGFTAINYYSVTILVDILEYRYYFVRCVGNNDNIIWSN